MAGSSFGKHFKVTTWGESHGKAIGAVIDGVPAGLTLTEEDLAVFLMRRKPGMNPFSTQRTENDRPKILSGTFHNITTGTPVSVIIPNTSQNSSDYDDLAGVFRPGHADYSYEKKYGIRDYRGGGRSSGRETAGRVIAGAVASKILSTVSVDVTAYTKSIGPVELKRTDFTKEDIFSSSLYLPDRELTKQAENYLKQCMAGNDSAGGVVECVVNGMPAGVGEPVFDKLDAELSKAVMSIGAVKAVEIGDGVKVSQMTGSQNNDPFIINSGKIEKKSNHSGGLLGGISDGGQIVLRAHIKPTPSISRKQSTVTGENRETEIEIHGRHDPVIVPRAVVVVESMVAVTLLDAMIDNMSSRLSSFTSFYR